MKLIAGITLCLLLSAEPATSASYFVATTGVDTNPCTSASPCLTVSKGLSLLVAGDTLVIRDGTYAGALNAVSGIPNGTAANYITIKAETEGNVIVTAGLTMVSTNQFIQIQGLRFQDTSGRIIMGTNLKFLRNEFKGGCASGNCTNTSVGDVDPTVTSDILFEDNWFHGAGGRYNLLIFNSLRVVVRRAVIRHDGGWDSLGTGNPEAGITLYNTRDSAVQNVMVIDSNQVYSTWNASFYAVKNGTTATPNQNNTWVGCLALVGGNTGFTMDTAASDSNTIQDCTFWDTINGGVSLGSGANTNVTINRVNTGLSQLTGSGTFQGGFGKFGTGTETITNVIIANFVGPTGKDFTGTGGTFFDTFNNGVTSTGTGSVTYSPFLNGLSYLPRIEAGSALLTAGSSGGQIGALFVNRIGTPGTLQGETGWNTVTTTALWPWPNEARIKKEMCTDPGITLGFCSDTSLTRYVMNYLGNGNPYGIKPPAPTNLRVE